MNTLKRVLKYVGAAFLVAILAAASPRALGNVLYADIITAEGATGDAIVAVLGGYARLTFGAGAPTSTDCDVAGEKGRQYIDTTNTRFYFCNGTAWAYAGSSGASSRATLSSVFVGAVTTAGTTYGGRVLPAQAFTIDQITFRVSVAGSGGTTNFVFRATDGTNTCDCSIACNTAAGNLNPTCAGSAGAGCAIPASASLTYSVNSIGDCTVGPTIVGNADVGGTWQ